MSFQFSASHLEFVDESIADLDRRAVLNPDDLAPIYNKALLLLSIGRFAEGWKLWERRLDLPACKESYGHFPAPKWDGSDLAGKHVLVWFEQGIGDHIMAASMLPDLIAVAGSVTVLTMRRLVPLFRRSFPTTHVYKFGDPIPPRLKAWDFDYQMSVADLGLAFRRSWQDFTGKPFLQADAVDVAAFRQKYGRPGKPLVGVSWRSENHGRGALKSMAPDDFALAVSYPGATYVNLQYGDGGADLTALRAAGVDIIDDDTVDQLVDMDRFAAQVAAMDMIVTTSNSLVHLAGGLGVPASVMIPVGHGRCWYWFSEMDTSPWYGSVRLFRQDPKLGWTPTVVKAGATIIAQHLRQPCAAA